LALLAAFLSAQPGYRHRRPTRVELLRPRINRVPGAAMIQGRIPARDVGVWRRRIDRWPITPDGFAAYATMAALLAIGMLVFLLGPEPEIPRQGRARESSQEKPPV